MNTHRLLLVLTLFLSCASFVPASAADPPTTLTAAEKKSLDELMQEFVFDPKGCQRVTVKTVVRSVWTHSEEVPTEGWLAAGRDGNPARVYFADGHSIPAPPTAEITKIDFPAACRERYFPAKKEAPKQDDFDNDEVFRKMRRGAVGGVLGDDLVNAAWLYRMGDEALAAKALAVARNAEGDARQRLRAELAWSAFAAMIHAYMVRADEEALQHGERLLRLYADEAKEHFPQSLQIVDELKRRQKKGAFGKSPPDKLPAEFEKWTVKQKADYLIDALEEVDARQSGQPGGVDIASDLRVQALIRLGDSAVVPLLDVLDNDNRLTRAVHFWRDFSRDRTVLGVREAALTALMSILRVRVFEPVSTGDSFTARGEGAAKATTERLRAYWKKYGDMPFDERMMNVLIDPKANFEAKREAAQNLGSLNEEARLQTTIQPTIIGGEAPSKPNPAVTKFNRPTVAEAILAAMDADLKVYDQAPDDRLKDYSRRYIEDGYIFAVVQLEDKRIGPELARRSANADTVRMRRKWAYAAHWLGESQPIKAYADDFRTGKIKLAANDEPNSNDQDQPGNVELCGAISYLSSVNVPETERALFALTDPKHPFADLVKQRVLKDRAEWSSETPWFTHPFCLAILRRELDNTKPNGGVYKILQDRFVHEYQNGSSSGGIPEFLADPEIRRNEAQQRFCDDAADKLQSLVIGLPSYHPLYKDANQRLRKLRAEFDRFASNFRRASWREARVLGLSTWSPLFIPNIQPLDRIATDDDVKTGKAIFHLQGKIKPASLELPAAAILKKDEKDERPTGVLIVQAEIAADGQTTYGIITKDEVRMATQSELTDIKTFAEIDKEEEAAEKARRN